MPVLMFVSSIYRMFYRHKYGTAAKVGGFSLVELLVVVAMVGVLASMAAPVYSDYQVRAKAAEFLTQVAPARIALTEWASLHASTNVWPASDRALAIPEIQGTYVQNLEYRRSANTSIAGLIVKGKVDDLELALIFEGTLNKGEVRWACSASADDRVYFPKSCAREPSAGLGY